jgi:hypothetical protein
MSPNSGGQIALRTTKGYQRVQPNGILALLLGFPLHGHGTKGPRTFRRYIRPNFWGKGSSTNGVYSHFALRYFE